jgi:hypothetical protein
LNFKSRLILLFILIAVIPIIALSAVSAYTVLKFRDQLSTMYFGVNLNQAALQEGNQDLQYTKINLLQYIGSQNANQQSAAIVELESNSNAFIESFGGYKKESLASLNKIYTFPLQLEYLNDENTNEMLVDEAQILVRINGEWNEYHSKIKDQIILSKDPNFRQTSLNNAAEALTLFDKLEPSYQSLITLNNEMAKVSYEASNNVVQLAYFYVSIAAAISTASATGAAILVSKRVILGDLVKKTKIELVETTLRDLLGEGADLILEVVKKEIPEGKEKKS